MNGLIDIRQVATQILGFLILLWIMRKYAWGPVLAGLEARRAKIAGEFAAAEKAKAEANETRTGQELIDAMQQARKLGLKLRPARVPALLRPPIDFSDDGR